ncbi:MAG: hypothetical protein QME64_12690, partial [bacterium]|nr:hypothetical protein [bacterium]
MQCPRCGIRVKKNTEICPTCGMKFDLLTQPNEAEVVPKEKPSRLARATLVIAILAVIGCPILIFGPIALVLGLIELSRIKKGTATALGYDYAIAGVIIGLIATLIIPLAIRGYYAGYLRSKVSQTRGDMRTISTSLEQYYVDFGSYPKPDFDTQHNPILPFSITTPTAYITTIPTDPFSLQGKQPHRYFAGREERGNYYRGYVIASLGPNNIKDLDVTTYNPKDERYPEDFVVAFGYDPRNGIISNGDILHT